MRRKIQENTHGPAQVNSAPGVVYEWDSASLDRPAADPRGLSTVADVADSESEPEVSARLVASISAGERAAEQEMVQRYERGLLFLLRRRSGGNNELALDLRQETLLIAIEKLRAGSITEVEKLGAFLRGIAVNVLMAHNRKAARRGTTADTERVEATADDQTTAYDEVSNQQAEAAVRALLEELPTPRDREILTRFYLNDEDKDVICRDLEIDAAHFSRVLYRAKQRFKELLSAEERRAKLRVVR